jgi:hypothetical protein
MLNIQGTTLNGFKTGVNLSSYTTMHIPKEITTIANNSFFDQSATSSKIPSNINVLDMSSASVLTNIGQRAFYEAPFSNTLIFPSSLTTLGGEAFCSSSIAGVNLSHCNLLLTVPGGCFGDCNSISTIDFNNNLQYIQNPIGAAGFGAFEVNGLSYSGSSFTGTLKLPSGIRELGNAAFANLGAQPGTTTNVVAIN